MKRSVGRPETASAASTALGPGIDGDLHAGRGRGLDEVEAGVGDRRHAGIAQHEQVGVAAELDELGRLQPLVVVVQRDEARPVLDVQGGEQPLRHAGVLRGDDLGGAERLDEPADASPRLPMGVPARMIMPPVSRTGECASPWLVPASRPRRLTLV